MAGFNPIIELTHQHGILAQLLQRHREALVAHQWARAGRLLHNCRKRLQYCVLVEEECFHSYCLEVGIPGRWSTCIDEHRRLDEMLDQAIDRLRVARRRGVSDRALLELIDNEQATKQLLEQHLQRESEELRTALASIPEEVRVRYVRAHKQAVERQLAPASAR